MTGTLQTKRMLSDRESLKIPGNIATFIEGTWYLAFKKLYKQVEQHPVYAIIKVKLKTHTAAEVQSSPV